MTGQHRVHRLDPNDIADLARFLSPGSQGPMQRRVFGDLVPIEQYRNGGEGRHQTDDSADRVMCFCPQCGEATRAYAASCDHCGYSPTTTTKES